MSHTPTPQPARRRHPHGAAPAPYHHDNDTTLYVGDARQILAALPDAHVQAVVTSPPYWGLRHYQAGPGEYGHEPTIDDYIHQLRSVFAEAARVLAPGGTCWLNLGDTYGGSWGNYIAPGHHTRRSHQPSIRHQRYGTHRPPGSRHTYKSLAGVPWRTALALADDGWILRNAIIWHRPNATPTSAADRLHNRHETLFLLTRDRHYTFDRDALRTLAGPESAGDVWRIPIRPSRSGHPAEASRELCDRIIAAATRPGEVVCDPFSGAGTTGHAALAAGRRYLGIDLNPDYHHQFLTTHQQHHHDRSTP
ncbi:DNA-methyltransferase [Actinocatenispora rupis]|uniref:Methyltransferase n=1 Tax=Actinocatenispora rupis TaxID=519421 RepID=A0A8J3J8C0_9ACTN|nr:site-specific DNA-methyltransferase [Actinocatenispora rupis]GID10233.1 methyltransferase [Actinocatenispora rupis]